MARAAASPAASPAASAAAVRAYLAALPPASRRALTVVRRTLRAALPTATERISYGIPALAIDGAIVVYYAGWAHHVSIYPASAALVASLGRALGDRVVSKGTIRFSLDEPISPRLVTRIAKLRAKEVAARLAARKRPPRRPPPSSKAKPRRGPARR